MAKSVLEITVPNGGATVPVAGPSAGWVELTGANGRRVLVNVAAVPVLAESPHGNARVWHAGSWLDLAQTYDEARAALGV